MPLKIATAEDNQMTTYDMSGFYVLRILQFVLTLSKVLDSCAICRLNRHHCDLVQCKLLHCFIFAFILFVCNMNE